MSENRSPMTVTIADFLLARIAEDESMAAVEQFSGQDWNIRADGLGAYAVRLARPARVLAECRSKRGILAEHPSVAHWAPGDRETMVCDQCSELLHPEQHLVVPYPCPTVRHLAAVYDEHWQYRDEWQPS